MLIHLDMTGASPIYVQLRNQIVLGIGRGELRIGDRLPSVRQLAEDAGVNAMTVNKAYAILKGEGFLEIDRRHGAKVRKAAAFSESSWEKMRGDMELLIAESSLKGCTREHFLSLCAEIFERLNPVFAQEGGAGA